MQETVVNQNGEDEPPHLVFIRYSVCLLGSKVILDARPIIPGSHGRNCFHSCELQSQSYDKFEGSGINIEAWEDHLHAADDAVL